MAADESSAMMSALIRRAAGRAPADDPAPPPAPVPTTFPPEAGTPWAKAAPPDYFPHAHRTVPQALAPVDVELATADMTALIRRAAGAAGDGHR